MAADLEAVGLRRFHADRIGSGVSVQRGHRRRRAVDAIAAIEFIERGNVLRLQLGRMLGGLVEDGAVRVLEHRAKDHLGRRQAAALGDRRNSGMLERQAGRPLSPTGPSGFSA